MNILVLNNSSDLYGSNKILIYVLRAMLKAGHTPIVVLSDPGPVLKEIENLGVEVRIIRLGILRRKYFTLPGIFNRVSFMRKAWKILDKLIDDEQIQLVWSNTTGVLIGGLLARRKKIRHIWHVHEIINSPKIFTKVIGYLLNSFCDKAVVVSDAVKNHWAKYVDAGKLIRIYNGIDTTDFVNQEGKLRQEMGLPAEAVIIGMIGRVNNWKGQPYFVALAKEILNACPDTKFVLAGDAFPGNEYLVADLRAAIKDANLSSSIFDLGFRTDIVNLMTSFDIFISPSIQPDPFPTVVLEAMAAGNPVVATAHGGPVEMVVNNVTGVLIPLNDPAVAAELIIPLIKDQNLRLRMGGAGRHRIDDHFSNAAFEASIATLF